MLSHDEAEVKSTGNIVMVILQGLVHRLTYGLETGKVDDTVDFFLFENLFQGSPVQKVDLVEGDFLTRDLLHTVECFPAGIIEVVHNNHFITGVQKLNTGMGTDVACTACNQD